MKKVLVTGATGFVGSHMVLLLAEKGIEVLAVVRNVEKATALFNHLPTVRIIQCNMNSYKRLPELIRDRDIDVVYHFAWEGSAGEARKDYRMQLENVEFLCDLLNAAKGFCCNRIVCAGSIMEQEVIVATELQGVSSLASNIYSSAKCASHQMAKALATDIGVDLIWGIITNAYGPDEISARFINSTLRKILHGEHLSFTKGTQNYDFIYITDLAEAFLCLGERGKPNCEYVLGSGLASPLKNFILQIKEVLLPEEEISFGTAPFTGISLPLSAFCTKKLEEDTGFRPKVSFAEGLRLTIDWLSSVD